MIGKNENFDKNPLYYLRNNLLVLLGYKLTAILLISQHIYFGIQKNQN